jgi:hypothetical protein
MLEGSMNSKNIATSALVSILVLGAAATTATDADAALSRSAHAVGNFELSVDGVGSAFVSSVDGGTMMSEVVADPGLRGTFAKKHITTPRFDPLEVTLAPTKPWVDFLNASLAGTEKPKPGALVATDLNFKEVSRRSFGNLRLSEVAMPDLSAADAKRAFELGLTFVADTATEGKAGGQTSTAASKRSTSMSNNFRVIIPGIDANRVVKVTSIVAKTSGAPAAVRAADAKFAATSTRAEVANFSIIISDAGSETWKAWYDSFVLKGKSTDADEKTLTIEMLNPTGATVVFRAKLEGVGILNLAPVQDKGEAPRQLQADLYAESIRFEDATGVK